MTKQDTNKKLKIFKALSLTSLICWMCLIFLLSAQESDQSAQLSSGWLAAINEFLGVELSHLFVRKAAHFTEYFVLGFLFSNAFYFTRQKLLFVWPLSLSALYALSDEIHQHFVPGRACSFKDVLIDCLGAMIGIDLYFILHKIYVALHHKFFKKGV